MSDLIDRLEKERDHAREAVADALRLCRFYQSELTKALSPECVPVEKSSLHQIATDMDKLIEHHVKSADCTYEIAHLAAVTRDLARKLLATA